VRRPLVPALLLIGYGTAFAVRAFGGGLPAFDDHPGQFFRLWHALDRSFPDFRWTADWNPDWWGGYPELQFYPPGYALAGAAIRLLSLWQLSVEAVYQILCGVVLLLPALGTFVLVARLADDAWLALPPAFLALTLSAGLRGGVEEGLRWGILTSRLALGVLPLLALSLRSWVDAGRRPVWAPVFAAALLLAHPAAAPAAAVLVGLAALLAAILRPRRATLRDAVAIPGFAGLIAGFWLLPFVARRGWVVPLAWGEADAGRVLGQLAARPLLVVLAAAALLAWLSVLARRRPFDALLAGLPLVLLAALAADAALFRRGWSGIEPDRLADALVLALLWAAGLGAGWLVGRLIARDPRGRLRPALAVGACLVLAALPGGAGSEPALTLWPMDRATRWPRLDELDRAHELARLWTALRSGSDRVLFLTSSLRLSPDPAWYSAHSHVLSLAPLLAGREIVHGTYTHPAPLAARFYAGTSDVPARVELLAERLDGQRVLGQPLARLSADAFEGFARRLRIATVVVPAADAERAGFLRERYAPARTAAGFAVFERRERPWPRVERITHRRYRVGVPATGGVWIPTGIAAYPLGQAKSGHGPLETRTDAWGLLEFKVPIDVFEAELVYAEGALEWAGVALALIGSLGWAAWAWRGAGAALTRRRRRSAPDKQRRE
jgi:hypothetical protein